MAKKTKKNLIESNQKVMRSEPKGHTPVKWEKGEDGNIGPSVDLSNPASKNAGELLLKISGSKDADLAASIQNESVKALEAFMTKEMAFNVVSQALFDANPANSTEARLVALEAVAFHHAMRAMAYAGKSDMRHEAEFWVNTATKFMRTHNETVETLSRLRRGGEQLVIVQHIAGDKVAVVNNLGNVSQGGGVSPKNQGATPCQQENAELQPEQIAIVHAVNPQWQADAAGSTEENQLAHEPKKVAGA